MQKSQRKVWMIVTGALFLAISIGLFTWYNTEVLTPEEVQRLESGGSGGDTAFESFAAFGSPLIALVGIAIIIFALRAGRKRTTTSPRPYL